VQAVHEPAECEMVSRDLVVQPLQHDGRSNKRSGVGRRWHSRTFAAGRRSGRQMEAPSASSVPRKLRGFPSSWSMRR
jgi:hypothetical protein